MSDITFSLDGIDVAARQGETIWDVARRLGTDIPHLCHSGQPGYRPDGNCRACMVEIDGERTLAASCVRLPAPGMVVRSQSMRATGARRVVLELLLADQPSRAQAHDRASRFWRTADGVGLSGSRFPVRTQVPILDDSHVAMRVNLDACIQCGLCVRACREVQVNDVIGMSGRGGDARIVFDQGDAIGASTCVACGECVQACPTGALMSATLLDADERGDSSAFEREVASVCPFCGVGCQVSLKVRDGRIACVEGLNGPANENRLCVKGRFGFDYVHHPHRLTRPLIRREDAPAKGLNVDPANPLTHFREATWDEALEAAAGGLARLREQRGGRSVAGFGSAKCTNEEAYLFQRLIREGFGHNNVDHCTRLCHASSVAALMENIGSGAVTATFNQIENADTAIVIGCNPVENHPVAATWFKQFARRGGKLIVMDPRGVTLGKFATHMLRFRPGTDVALLNGIMAAIVEEGLENRAYIERFTENWKAQKAHLADYPPEKMADICGIDASILREVARLFAGSNAAMIFWGMGVSQHIHGTDNARCLISLALMCGQVGRPGTGLHPLRGQNNVQGASDAGLVPMFLPDYQSVTDDGVRAAFNDIWQSDSYDAPDKGLTVVEIMDAIHAGDIRGMYILGENPAMSDPDLEHARAALAKLEHLVVEDIFLTETANYADVILPASAFAEKTGTVTNTNRQVQMGRPAVDPPGDARADWTIIVDLANRLGLGWTYSHPREVFSEMKRSMKSLANITWKRLEREAVTYPTSGPDDPGEAIVFGDGFPRSGGRARFAPVAIVPPDDLPDGEFPMILTTGRQLEHWHTGAMTRRSAVLDSVEPEANASLNPRTLRALGVKPGGLVRLTTKRGSVVTMARADRAVAEDMVFLPFAYVEAAANLLTNPALDPVGKIPEFKFSAVRVEKADEVVAQ
ncbi:MAG: formate dehydrogenase subunit alpha [Paracoccaceae bacterium]